VDSVNTLLSIFGDSLLHPDVSNFHFNSMVEAAVEDSKQLESDAGSVLSECAHVAGFGGRGLGRRSNPGSSIIASLTPEIYSRHVNAASSPSAITVAASGVDHASFVAATASIFGNLKGSSPGPSSTAWIGGDSRASMAGMNIAANIMLSFYVFNSVIVASAEIAPTSPLHSDLTITSGDGLCHIALSFQGASQSSKDLVPLAVLSTLLGGGDSFSSGGPGKGMTSMLYENVLNRHHFVASALATHFMYGTGGMFTLKGSCDPSAAGNLAAVLAQELKSCVDNVSAAQFERARNATASIVLINSEHGAVNAEDMGRQVCAQSDPAESSEIISHPLLIRLCLPAPACCPSSSLSKFMHLQHLTYSA
jgi:processing peptidase subunit alpha